MPNPYMTYADLVDNVVSYSGNDPSAAPVQRAVRAANVAYTNLVKAKEWSFYKRVFSVSTQANQSDGTITYDHTGGSAERLVTLAGSTWPSWAAYAYISVGEKCYQVATRLSDTTITLAEFNNPGADIAAGTSYNLLRDMYPLPFDFVTVYSALTMPGGIMLTYVPIAQWAFGRNFNLSAGRPYLFTITGDLNVPQRKAVRVYPATDTDYEILFTYKATVVTPVYNKITDGLVTLTANSATVTGSNTKWESGMAGSVLRTSRNSTTLPTGPEGDNPAFYEYIIDSVQSDSSLTLQSNAVASQNRVKATVSSLLDIDWLTHREYLLRESEYQYRLACRSAPTAGEMNAWQKSKTEAMENDANYSGWQGASPWRPRLTIFDVGPVPSP